MICRCIHRRSLLTFLIIIGVLIGVSQHYRDLSSRELISPVGSSFAMVLPTPTPIPDSRIEALRNYLEKKNSPMSENAETFIEIADTYGFDWRLLPAITGAESSFGKRTPSCASFNPFGWRSSTSPCGWWRFESFDEAIRQVGEKLAKFYPYAGWRQSGNLNELAQKYDGGNPDKWTGTVSFLMEEMK